MTPLADLIGESPGMVAVREQIGRLLQRQSDSRRLPSILIQGETGTGKGLLARAIHRAGSRAAGPFVEVSCAAIPETLLEAELFGFERGAFTDARQAKPGLFQSAHRGAIFLDEVGLLPQGLQGKLLTAIEERVVRRLGSTRSEPLDVWVLTATNEDLAAATRARRFREDLYHRLAVLTLRLPPLRERGRDVLLLAEHFLARASADYNLPPKTLSADAPGALLAYRWPGNVRELSNVIERVVLLSDAPLVTAEALGLAEAPFAEAHEAGPGEALVPLEAAVGSVEREHLLEALRQTGWNISRSAARLGISRNTLRYRIEKHGLRRGVSAAPSRERAGRAAAPAPAAPPAVPPVIPAPAVIRWERRRLTLLRAALVSPGGERSAVESSPQLGVLMQKAQSFGGRVEELSPTGIVAAFGLEPVEDAPRRAAHAAMAIQKAVERDRLGAAEQQWAVKLVIHISEVMVGRVNATVEIDVDAKRQAWTALEALVADVEADAIFVTEAAVPFLERWFDLVPVGRPPAKAYRLWGRERVGLGPGGRMARFVGRHHDLELLRDRFESAVRGQGQLVGIAGDAGIGKSRLLFEFRQNLTEQPLVYLEGHCLSYASAIPYFPVLDLLRMSCGITEADTPETMREKVHVGLREAGLEPEGAPYLLHLLGLTDGTDRLAALDPQAIKVRTLEILRQMTLRGSRHNPLIIAVEDLQWIDKTSEEYFASLAESMAGARILMISTYRSGYRPPWIEKSYATQMALQPLTPEDSLSIVRSLLGAEEVAESLLELILAKAEGNPFFLEELARVVREQGDLFPTLAVPDTVEEVLLARIDRLPPEEKHILQCGAVVGKDVSFALLHAVADRPEESLRRGLAHLQGAEFLYETGRSPEVEYTFRHALTHEVAYESLLHEEKKVLHARVVEAIERLSGDRLSEQAEVLARHALRGEVWEKAVDYLREAGAKAYARSALQETLDRYEQALALVPKLTASPENTRRAIDIRLALHAPLLAIGQISRLLQLYREAEGLARQLNDQGRLGHVFYRIGLCSWAVAEYREGMEYARQALSIATTLDDPEVRVLATYALAVNQHALGEYRAAIDLLTRVVDGPDADLAKRLLAVTVSAYIASCGWLTYCSAVVGDFERAPIYGDRSVQAAKAADHPQAQAIAYTFLATLHAYRGDFAQALPWCEQAVHLCETKGLLVWLPAAYFTLGWVLMGAGRLAESIPYLERAASLHEIMGVKAYLSLRYVRWAEALLLAGQVAEARRVADRAVELAGAFTERGNEGEALYVRARVTAAEDPPALESARSFYERASALAAELEMRPLLARCHLDLGELAGYAGDRPAAAEHFAQATALFREMGMTFWLAQAEAAQRTLG